jgi:hypothetical protein
VTVTGWAPQEYFVVTMCGAISLVVAVWQPPGVAQVAVYAAPGGTLDVCGGVGVLLLTPEVGNGVAT